MGMGKYYESAYAETKRSFPNIMSKPLSPCIFCEGWHRALIAVHAIMCKKIGAIEAGEILKELWKEAEAEEPAPSEKK